MIVAARTELVVIETELERKTNIVHNATDLEMVFMGFWYIFSLDSVRLPLARASSWRGTHFQCRQFGDLNP